MNSLNYLASTVFDEALRRIQFVFDECDDVIVSMSGGKDSTVIFELAKIVARERGRLPLKVLWLDQEAEWKATEDYMRGVMYSPEVRPFWFQIPFRLTNSLSFKDNYLACWDPAAREDWIRGQDPISIKTNPTKHDRFKPLVQQLASECDCRAKKHVGELIGMRMEESYNRRTALAYGAAKYKGINWCRSPIKNTRAFFPIYDWNAKDIWTALAKNGWSYNAIYDLFYRYGIARHDMRVSALIHETSWICIERIHEVEPDTYNRFLARLSGVNCFSHFSKEIMPSALPVYFQNWREYRDYLLDHLIEEHYHATFKARWKSQTDEEWYKKHVMEIMVNDIDGTKNSNDVSVRRMKSKRSKYKDSGNAKLREWLSEHKER